MAIIPYIERTVKTADAPAPVLDQNRRPSVDVSGQVNGLNRLAGASEMPLIDPDPFVAKDRALSRAGQAVAEAGGVMMAVAQQRAKAKDYTDITTAKARLDDAKTEFEIWKAKNPDPSTWSEGWKQHFAGVEKGVMQNPNLSARAREQISALSATMGRSAGLRVELDATVTIGQQAAAAATVSADEAYNRMDKAAGDAILKDAVNSGFLAEDRAYALSKGGEQVVKKREEEAVWNQNYGAILADADGWLAANKGNANGLDPKLHNNLEAQAHQQKRLNQSALAANFADAMVTDGAIKKPEDIDALLAGQRPAVVAEAKRDWLKLQDDKVQAYNASLPGLLDNTGKLMGMIDAFDPKSKNADAERIRTEYLIKAMVPEGYRASLVARLDAKFNPPKTPTNPTLAGWGNDQISAWFKDGKFGAVTRPVQEGEPGYLEPKFKFFGPNEPQVQTETVPDPAMRDNAMMARAKVEMDWMDWQRKNPNASIEEGRKALGGIVKGKLKSSDLDALMSAPVPAMAPEGARASDVLNRLRGVNAEPPNLGPVVPTGGKITSYGYQNDETPDSNSTAGIGAWVPAAEQAKIKRGEPSEYRLRENDFAVSRDVEAELRAAGVKPMDTVTITLADGSRQTGRWMDRTADEWPLGSGKKVTGRWDFYRAGKKGHHAKEAAKVTGFSKA